MDRKQVDFGREKEVFPLVLIQVKSAAKRTVFDLKNKREKTFLPFKTQLFHIQVVRYAVSVCGFNFGDTYGKLGQDYIHVHHITPISTIGEEYEINPQTDLVPICPNCHAMIHKVTPPLQINELQKLIGIQK